MVTWRAVALLAALSITLPWWPAPLLGVLCCLAAVLALCVADVLAAAPTSAVRLRRGGDRRVRLGRSAEVTLWVTNRATRPLRAELHDAWLPSAGPDRQRHRLTVPAGGTRGLRCTLTPTRRGDRRAERVTVRSYGPLRMAYRQAPARRAAATTPPWTLRVLPAFASRRYLAEKLSRLRLLDGSAVTRGRGAGTEFDALREYVPGDDVRSIDWRGSARRGGVVVRTWRPERDRRLVCIVDTGRTSAVRVGDVPRLDVALDACLLLATVAGRAGDRVDLLAADTVLRAALRGGTQAGLLPRLADTLAPLEPSLVETDFEMVSAEVLRSARKRSLLVLFTALEPGALSEGLLPVLPTLTDRHRVVVAAVHDPTLPALCAGRGDTGRLYAAAAAERALAERARVRAALEGFGALVVDSPADTLASDVTDTYLALKSTGHL